MEFWEVVFLDEFFFGIVFLDGVECGGCGEECDGFVFWDYVLECVGIGCVDWFVFVYDWGCVM